MRPAIFRPGWTLILFVFWLLLQGQPGPGSAVLGLGLAFAVAGWLAPAPLPGQLRAGVVLRLTARVMADIVTSNLVVAHRVIFRSGRLRPAFVEVPLRLEDEFRVAALASIISLTPGTLSIEHDPAARNLLIHALDCDDPAVLIESIRVRYESLLLELYA